MSLSDPKKPKLMENEPMAEDQAAETEEMENAVDQAPDNVITPDEMMDCTEVQPQDEVNQNETCPHSSAITRNRDQKEKEHTEYEIRSVESIFDTMMAVVHEASEVIALPAPTMMTLLSHLKWDKDRLLEVYFEDEEKLMKEAKVISPMAIEELEVTEEAKNEEFTCDICYTERSTEQSSAMLCGHRFCNPCWSTYLKGQIMNEGACQKISCPATKCPIIVDYAVVHSVVTDQDVIKKYHQLMAKNFVESNRLWRWCPGAGCDKAVSMEAPKWLGVKCPCGTSFCFLCGRDWHEPIKCDSLDCWLKKCQDDSETSTWMQANTKDCPKCKSMIEKNGGCNHMTCRIPSCRYEFCWICMGDWKTHTGSAYNCNRYDEAKNLEAGEARAALQRYLHYYERYMSHMQSLKFETKLIEIVKGKMEYFQRELKMSWVDVQFFKRAAETLCACRRTLMYTYCFAFFLEKSCQAEIFEDNQRDLQAQVEVLSGHLENDILPDGSDLKIDPKVIRSDIVNSYLHCETRRILLIDHVLEGYADDFWTYRSAQCQRQQAAV